MPEIVDFKCTYLNEGGLNEEIAERLQLVFPDAHLQSETMCRIALALKEEYGAPFCTLPFCHTVEGDAMGGKVNYGDAVYGPRAGGYVCTAVEELLELKDIDFESGRIAEVLNAAKTLSQNGETVALEVCGPFTILNVLIDAKPLFKALRKQPDMFSKIFDYVSRNLLEYISRAVECGVSIISYADSAGGVNILGPKITEAVVDEFIYPFLTRALEIMDGKALMVLCPKTTLALIGTEKAGWGTLELGREMGYREGCLAAVGKTKMVGETCLKNSAYKLSDGTIRTVILK